MAIKHVRVGLEIFGVVAFVGIMAMLLVPEPKAAWNSGARDRLSDALKTLGMNLANDQRAGSGKIDPGDFIPRGVEDKAGSASRSGILLLERHGVSVRWRRSGGYEKLLFYPIAVSRDLVIEVRSDRKPTPRIAMVPVEEEDVETLPNLSGCRGVTAEEMWECQARRMKALFAKHGMESAMILRSDGSAWALSVDEVCDCVRGMGEEKRK